MQAFGLQLEVQEKILDTMSDTMYKMRVKGKSSLMPFQKGIIQSNNALKLLFKDLKEIFGLNYILTYRLNQDVLEQFFGQMRSKGGLYDHPDALDFRYRLRNFILGRNEGSMSEEANVEEDDTPDGPINNIGEILLSGKCLSSLTTESSANQENGADDSEFHELNDLKYDALEHLTGYICHKMKLVESRTEQDQATFTWTDQLSEGGLIKPPEELVKKMAELEVIFNKFNGDNIKITKNYLKSLLDNSKSIDCNTEIK